MIRAPGISVSVTVTPRCPAASVTSPCPTSPALSFAAAADCMVAAGPPFWVWPSTAFSAVCIMAASMGAIGFEASSPDTGSTSPYLMGSTASCCCCSGLRGCLWLIFELKSSRVMCKLTFTALIWRV
uniref:Uncharacterized protein n=1 Tax=Opuntia streptacantha TaxID=393608 RepID=A0A7C9DIH6_OPUST